MTQYNRVNVKLSGPQLNKLKAAIKNETEIVLRLSLNMIGDSNDETNFPHELLLKTGKFLAFVKLLLIILPSILNFQKLSYQKWYNQEDFSVNYLVLD